MKKTWKLLPKIFGDQFRITEREAIKILEESIYSKHWKHGPAGAAGIMWRDEEIKELFNFVLLEEDILVKKVGRKKVQKELFYRSHIFKDFVHKSGLLYKKNTAGYKTFKNDYGKWKRLKYFKPSWKRGTKTFDSGDGSTGACAGTCGSGLRQDADPDIPRGIPAGARGAGRSNFTAYLYQ